MQELSGAKYSTGEQNKEMGKARQHRDMNDTHTLLLKAPLHDAIRSYGSCRLPCTRVNRKVWHVARMSRTRANRVKRKYSSFYFRAESAARAVRLPNQSAADYKTIFTLYDYERETGRPSVYQCT